MATYHKLLVLTSILLLVFLSTVHSRSLKTHLQLIQLDETPQPKIAHCREYVDERDDKCKECDKGFGPSLDHTKCFRLGKSCHFPHCNFCQATIGIEDLACAVCDIGFQVTADANFGGVCLLKNTLENCIIPETTVGFQNGQLLCFECAENFVMSSDMTACNSLPPGFTRIENCHDYVQLANGTINCEICNTGFTLTLQNTCQKGCSVRHCDVCLQVPDSNGNPIERCNLCRRGYIGIFDLNPVINFPECLTLEEYETQFVQAHT